MARFEIVYTETSVLLYEVEAENEEEAQEKRSCLYGKQSGNYNQKEL